MIIWMCYVGFAQSSRGSSLYPVWRLNPLNHVCIRVFLFTGSQLLFVFFLPENTEGTSALDSVSVTKLNQAQSSQASVFSKTNFFPR